MLTETFFLDQIKNISISNKYSKWYCRICQQAHARSASKNEAREILGYVEAHHVVPRSVLAEYTNESNNIVYLSAREHFICHWLLSKMFYGEHKRNMVYALHMLTNSTKHMIRLNCSRQYQRVKEYNRTLLLKEGPHNKGQSRQQSTIDKIKETKQNNKQIFTPETRRKMSESRTGNKNHMFGKHHTDETRKKISEATKGRIPHNKEKSPPPDLVERMIKTKRGKSAKFKITNTELGVVECLTISEFCDMFKFNYYNVYSSAVYKGKYFNWQFTPV